MCFLQFRGLTNYDKSFGLLIRAPESQWNAFKEQIVPNLQQRYFKIIANKIKIRLLVYERPHIKPSKSTDRAVEAENADRLVLILD